MPSAQRPNVTVACRMTPLTLSMGLVIAGRNKGSTESSAMVQSPGNLQVTFRDHAVQDVILVHIELNRYR